MFFFKFKSILNLNNFIFLEYLSKWEILKLCVWKIIFFSKIGLIILNTTRFINLYQTRIYIISKTKDLLIIIDILAFTHLYIFV